MIVELVSVGEVPQDLVEKLSKKIEWAFVPLIEGCTVGPSIEIPSGACNSERRQYDADMIMDRVLQRLAGENKVLGVLGVDLYTPSQNLNFIFGQAQLRGKAALVSYARLDPRFYDRAEDPNLLFNRLVKEAVHELGHTFGLVHCTNSACVLNFSNSVTDVDNKTATLCKDCRKKIQDTGTIRTIP